ncbi:unnamed protein product [Trichobilharzia regenti]|nr:unnamed protein product [Trichobilharzia regenti]
MLALSQMDSSLNVTSGVSNCDNIEEDVTDIMMMEKGQEEEREDGQLSNHHRHHHGYIRETHDIDHIDETIDNNDDNMHRRNYLPNQCEEQQHEYERLIKRPRLSTSSGSSQSSSSSPLSRQEIFRSQLNTIDENKGKSYADCSHEELIMNAISMSNNCMINTTNTTTNNSNNININGSNQYMTFQSLLLHNDSNLLTEKENLISVPSLRGVLNHYNASNVEEVQEEQQEEVVAVADGNTSGRLNLMLHEGDHNTDHHFTPSKGEMIITYTTTDYDPHQIVHDRHTNTNNTHLIDNELNEFKG